MDQTRSIKVLHGFSWFTIIIGALLLVFGVYFVASAWLNTNWPSVEGKITSIVVKKQYPTTRTSSQNTRASIEKAITYFYQIHYNYIVEGTSYSGSRYSLGTGSTVESRFKTEEQAREAAHSRFQQGDKIKVYFDPNDPASAVLSSGLNSGTFVPALLGLFFLASGVFIKVILKANS